MKIDQKRAIWRISKPANFSFIFFSRKSWILSGRQLLTFFVSITLIGSTLSVVSTPANAVEFCKPEVIESGGYITLKFLEVGTCTFSTPVGSTVMQGLIVGGGGGGGTDMGGGGGGGGYVDFETLTVTSQTLTITVGDGGVGAAADTNAAGLNGGNSVITGTGISLTSLGGAGGGSLTFSNSAPARSGGGSGGGAPGGEFNSVNLNSPGNQTSQSQTPSLSSIGGNQFGNNGSPKFINSWNPGGGGGAGSAGTTNPGNGGDGFPNSILGTSYYWAGGGGGSGNDSAGGNGGIGGGGAGGKWGRSSTATGGAGLNSGSASPDGNAGGNGGANTGGGGGGSAWGGFGNGNTNAGNGGSGIVVLRYLAPSPGTASRVKIARAAVGTERGVAFTTQPQIGFRDANFNTVTTSSPVVTATVNNGGTLVGTTTASATSGLATFTDLGVQGNIGTTYTITYSAPGLTSISQAVTLTGTNCDGTNFVCQPGDISPSGGVIFYAPDEPFSCGADFTSLCTYLEAAPKNWKVGGVDDPGHYFKAAGIYINGVSQDNLLVEGIAYDASPNLNASQIGLGLKNSNILSAFDTSTGNAAVASRSYTGGSKNDWYLPTLAELQLLCQFSRGQVPALGNSCDYSRQLNAKVPSAFTFLNTAYQSSSQSYTNWHQNFSNSYYGPGEHATWGYAPDLFPTRPIRAFAATVSPAKVAVTRAPSGAERRAAFTTQPQVTIQSSGGVRDFSASGTVTATVSAGGTLVGTTTATATQGRATFSNLGIDGTVGTSYTITFTVSGLTVATTSVTPTGTSCDGTSFTCQVGDTGPGGGTIYYYSSTGFDCGPTQTGTCNYLEVAPNSWNGGGADPQVAMLAVRNDALSIPGVDQDLTFKRQASGVGLGYKNSRAFKRFVNSNNSVGAGLVGAYRGGGKADWYIPSSTEMNMLCQWALGVTQSATAGCSGSTILRGGFTSGPYWTSSQWTDGTGNFGGYIQYFSDGSTNADQWGDAAINLRPVRAFGLMPTEVVVSTPAILGIPTPVRGETPVTTVNEGIGYTGEVSWSPSPSRFGSSTIYTATITLSAEYGYTFSGVSANFFTVAGATSVTNSANSGEITAIFPVTGVFSGAVSLSADRLVMPLDSNQSINFQTNAPDDFYVASFYKDIACGDVNFYRQNFNQISDSYFLNNGLPSYYYDCGNSIWMFRIYETGEVDPDLTTPYLASISVALVAGSAQIPFISYPASSSTFQGQVGTAFNLTSMYNSGVTPETFTVSSGELPPGLTLDQSGNITGVPTSAGSYTASITLTDDNNLTSIVSDIAFVITGSTPPPPTPNNSTYLSIPSPRQQSKITDISVSTVKAGIKTPVSVSGSFIEKITNISIDGVNLLDGQWVQTSSEFSFTLPALTAGRYVIQIYNGSAPVLKSIDVTVEKVTTPKPTATPKPTRTPKPVVTATPTPKASTPAPSKSPAATKQITIKCVKGKTVKFVKGTKPKCPTGYLKR